MDATYQPMLIRHRGSFDARLDRETLILPNAIRHCIPDVVAFNVEALLSYFEIAHRIICDHEAWTQEEFQTAMTELRTVLKGHVPDAMLNPPTRVRSRKS